MSVATNLWVLDLLGLPGTADTIRNMPADKQDRAARVLTELAVGYKVTDPESAALLSASEEEFPGVVDRLIREDDARC